MASTRRRIVGMAVAVVVVATPWSAVDAGAVTPESTPLTFGANEFGQLGDGSSSGTVRATAGDVTGLDDIVDIGGGREHVIALHADGTVSTWGSDDHAQLGNGSADTSNHDEPVSVPGLTDVVDVDDGHYHSLAVKSDGTLWGWGFGSLGQLGNNSTASKVHSPVRFGTLSNVSHVFGGRDMTYALLDDGTVWCSGGNQFGECGDDSYVSKIDTPVEVPGLTSIVDMAGGRNHGVALKSNGTVWTWGLNDSGQLGDGSTTKRAQPEQVAGLSNIVDVGAGADHSIAVTADGHVFTWGAGDSGQLGLGSQSGRLVPTEVPGVSNAAISEAGRDHTLIITDDGHLITWGRNEFKQAGTSSPSEVLSPFDVPNLNNVVAAAGGQAYTVVLQTNQPPPPPLFEDGFDNGLANWTGGGNFEFDATRFPVGATEPSLRAVLSHERAAATRGLPTAAGPGACAYVQTRVESVNTSLAMLRLRADDGTEIARLVVGKDRRLRVKATVAGVTHGTGVQVPLNQWHELGLCAVRDSGAADQVAVTFDGNDVGRWTLDNGNLFIGQVQIGAANRVTATFNLDDVVVTES
jgi:alpha-tubulin suppressor-like RCC1 family protein